MAFEITGRLHIVGPDNLRQVTSKLHKDLSNISGTISYKFDASGVSKAHKAISALRQNLASLNSSAGLGKLAPQLGNISKQSTAASKSVSTFGASIAGSVKGMAAFAAGGSVLLATISKIREGFSEALSWDRELTRIGVVSGKTSKQLGGLKDEIHDLSIGLGVQSKGLTASAMTLVQTGMAADKVRKSLKALALSDLAPTFDNIKNTTEGAISLFGSMGTTADTLGRDLGKVNAVSAAYAVESSDLVTAVRRTGASFKMAGGNLSELLGLFSSVRSRTRESANVISTGFRTIFARLQDPNRQKRLKEMLGVDLAEGGKFVGPMKAIERLHYALKDLPQGSTLFAKAASEIGGIRRLSQVVPLITEYKTAIEAANVAERGQNSLVKDSVLAQQSLSNAVEKTTQSWQKFWHILSEDAGVQTTSRSLLALSRAASNIAEKLIPILPALATLGAVSLGRSAFRAIPKVLGKANGGVVPGSGSGDTVPAMLTPGEFVINKQSASRIGFAALSKLNKFGDGGMVGGSKGYGLAPAEGGLTAVMRELVSVIRDEVSLTRQSLADRKLGKGNIPLSGDAGYALAKTPSRRSRAAAAMQYAMQLPLSRYDVDTNAANVVSGLPDDFRGRPSTYGLAPPGTITPEPIAGRNRNYRRMSRADREARIADLGGSDLLASVRRNALARQQAEYFENIGYSEPARTSVARRSLGGLASAGRTTHSFLKNRIGFGKVGTVGLLGASYGLSEIGGNMGTVGNGVLGGAATGMAAGSVGGPIGSAAGAVAGSVIGLVRSLDELKTAAADKSIETGFSRIEHSLTSFGEALEKADGKINKEVQRRFDIAQSEYASSRSRNSIAQTEKDSTLQMSGGHLATHGLLSVAQTVPGLDRLFKTFANGASIADVHTHLDRNRSEANRKEILAHDIQAGGQIEGPSLNYLNASLGNFKSYAAFRSDATNQRSFHDIARYRTDVKSSQQEGGFSPDQYKSVFEKEKAALDEEYSARHKSISAVRANADAIDSFARAATAATSSVAALNSRFADFQNATKSVDNANSLLTGMTGSGPASIQTDQHSTALARFGSAGFEQAAGMVGGPAGTLLTHANRAHKTLSEILPSVIGSQDIGTDQGFSNMKANMGQAFNIRGVHPDMQKEAFEQLDKIKNDGGLTKYATGLHNSELASKLTQSDAVKAAQSEGVTHLQNFESLQQRHLSNFGQLHSLRNTAGEAFDQSAAMKLQTKQAFAANAAERFGGHETDYLKHSDYLHPLLSQNQRLTGLPGKSALNPQAIQGRIATLTGQVDHARNQVENKQGGMEAIANLRKFENELQNAVKGLHNLTDSAKLSSGAVERLAHLQADKSSKRGLAEQYLTASPEQKKEMDKSARLAKHVAKHGIESLDSHEDRQSAMSFFHNAGDAKIFGGMTGSEHARMAIEKSSTFKGIDTHAGERAKAQSAVLGASVTAANAQDALAGIHTGIAGAFGKNIGADMLKPLPNLVPQPGPMMAAPAAPIEDTRTNGEKRSDARAARKSQGQTLVDLNRKLRTAKPEEKEGLLADIDKTKGKIGEAKSVISTLGGGRGRLPGSDLKAAAYQAGKQARKDAYNAKRSGGNSSKATAEGEQKGKGGPSDFLDSLKSFGESTDKFSEAAEKISQAAEKLSGMPHTVDVQANAKHEHVFNGAEALTNMMPQFTQQIEQQATAVVNGALSKHFPDAGPFT